METLALSVIILTTLLGTVLYLRRTNRRFAIPKATLALAVVTFAISAIGDLNPDGLHLLDRNRSLLLDGEWWRLVTPLFVQDGGWPGTVFNLISLIVIGLCVETLYRRRTLLAVYFFAGVISEIFAYTLIQHQGFAGNSVANLGLAGLCLGTLCAVNTAPARVLGIIGALGGILLIATGNLHGVGFAVGALASVAAMLRSRLSRRHSSTQQPLLS